MGELFMDRLQKNAGSSKMGIVSSDYGALSSSILSAFSVAQIHSLINPSYEDLRNRSSDPVRVAAAEESLNKSLVMELAAAGILGLLFESVTPALVAGGVSVGLYALGQHALKSPVETT